MTVAFQAQPKSLTSFQVVFMMGNLRSTKYDSQEYPRGDDKILKSPSRSNFLNKKEKKNIPGGRRKVLAGGESRNVGNFSPFW